MNKHRSLTEERIRHVLARISSKIYTVKGLLNVEAFHIAGEPIPAPDAIQQTYQPFAVGETWGPLWGTTWFRFSGMVPEPGAENITALVHLGFLSGEGFTVEGLVWQGGLPTRAINVNRMDVPIETKPGSDGTFEFYVEAAANPVQAVIGDSAMAMPDPQGAPHFVLKRADLAYFEKEVFHTYHDLKVAFDTMMALPLEEPRRAQLLAVLNEAANIYDNNLPSLVEARAVVAPLLARKNSDSAHQISAIGHAHIDTAWLWPLRETIRKCARTFATQLAYMEEYPEYVFGCSQAQQYAWMKEYYPSIYEGIKQAVARGQWEPIGSMWVECDCNLVSGESLIRQIFYGKKFFREEFGVETSDVWIPDVFGYSASMPQIMKKAGVDYFLTQKISWSQFNKFPHHTFTWEGIDGTGIFTHFPPVDTYNADFTPGQLIFNVHNFKEHDRATRSLYVYGFGDGGGGPTREMLETARRVQDLEGLPKVVLEKVSEFFPKAEKDAKDLPVWVGELYLELHRGTYTTQAATKRGNRKSEFLLRDAEFFESLSTPETYASPTHPRAVYDVTGMQENANSTSGDLERAWKLLLLNQFHDIIPGSSIHWVYQDAARDYETISALCGNVLTAAQNSLLEKIDTSAAIQPVVVFNTLSHARHEVVKLASGAYVKVDVPACGYRVIDETASQPEITHRMRVETKDGSTTLDNGILRVIFDQEGMITGLFDQRTQREVIPKGERGNLFQLHEDLPIFYDAWDVDIYYKERKQDITQLNHLEIVENTAHRAAIQIERSFGKSHIRQRIVLTADSARLDFETEVDWQEDHQFLKVAFPVLIHSQRATCEIQYGHTERPTHYNTSWDMARFEVCAQKWVDLSEPGYGVALLNDCKYGHDIFGHVMRLSLLRAPTAPDPLADRGVHHFSYALLPHAGDFRDGGVIEQAYALNSPLHVVETKPHPGSLPAVQSFFSVDHPAIILETIKNADARDGVIVRCYEAHGSRGTARLKTSLPALSVARTDLLENEHESLVLKNGEVAFDFAPFEIITLKFSN